MATKNPAKDLFAHPIRKYQTLLTQAKTFFTKEKETEYQPIIIFVFLYVLVGKILEFVAWVPTLGSLGSKEMLLMDGAIVVNIILGAFGIFITPLVTLICTFIAAGMMHLGVSYYKKGAPYFLTWKVAAYAALIPIIYNVFSTLVLTVIEAVNPWPEQSIYAQVPSFGYYYITMAVLLILVGLAILIHVIYTEIVGLKLYHKLTTKQAAIAVIVPFVLVIFLIILVVVGFVSIFSIARVAVG